ncbi:XTP/dITP diphosphatase [Acetonema longum]|uniref:dITP/XTP pyrophosphatase n=1 Tax=Acetonema longum DSM 6540 TaxID=1009370 RepID=F7NEK9_9FIRM|nr:XTP/dITP diphosphatase [Acetonema longum]EGO65420.1 non-canonical purine NTP pyrophosphatase, rdgB/HAM1 family protein [Acetonema longum DSM 6540]
MTKLIVASKNRGKIAEIAAKLAASPFAVLSVLDVGDIPEPEETGSTFAENAELKARYYAGRTGLPCLADDSGLEVDVLDSQPGVYSARFAGEHATDAANNEKLLGLLANVPARQRTARFRCALAFIDPEGTLLTADGTCEGIILGQPRGSNGFGYDPLFYIPALGKTLAEIDLAEKNRISHRARALGRMAGQLREYRP